MSLTLPYEEERAQVETEIATRLDREEQQFRNNYPEPTPVEWLLERLGASPIATRLQEAWASYNAWWADQIDHFRGRNRNRLARLIPAERALHAAQERHTEALQMIRAAEADLRLAAQKPGLILHAQERVSPTIVERAMKRRAGLLPSWQSPIAHAWAIIGTLAIEAFEALLSIVSGFLLVCSALLWGFMEPKDLLEILGFNPITGGILLVGTVLSTALGHVMQSTFRDLTVAKLDKGRYPSLGLLRSVFTAIAFAAWFGQIWLDANAAHEMAILRWRLNNPFSTATPEIGSWWGYFFIGLVVASVFYAFKMGKGIYLGFRDHKEEESLEKAEEEYELLQKDEYCKRAIAAAREVCHWEMIYRINQRTITTQRRIVYQHQPTILPSWWARRALRESRRQLELVRARAQSQLSVPAAPEIGTSLVPDGDGVRTG